MEMKERIKVINIIFKAQCSQFECIFCFYYIRFKEIILRKISSVIILLNNKSRSILEYKDSTYVFVASSKNQK